MSTADDCDRYMTQLMGQVATILDGVSDIEMKVQLFDVLREVFDNSNAWLETINFQVIPNLLDYPLRPISGRIMRLSGVLDQNNVGQPAVMPVIGTVHFLYPYSNSQPMTAVVCKNVDDPLDCFPPDFPSWVLPQYGRMLLDGMLGNLMSQPNQSYTDKQQGLFHQQRFRDQTAHMRVAAMRMNTIGSQAWAYPQQYRTFSQRGGVSTFNVNPTPTPLR